MRNIHKATRTLAVATALLAGVWASGASATPQSDVTNALGAPTAAEKNAALSSLSREGVLAAVAEGVGIGTIFDEGVVLDDMVVKLPIEGAEIVSRVDVVCLTHRKDSRIIVAFFAIADEIRSEGGV